jgi:protein-disulfide isomerase
MEIEQIPQESIHHSRRNKIVKFITSDNFVFPAVILVSAILIASSVIYSAKMLSKSLKGGVSSSQTVATSPTSAASAAAAPKSDAKVSVADSPFIGNRNAPLTMLTFSDFECPFCKSFYNQAYLSIKKDYIDTGKVKYVYRNLPLSFHQNAHKEAEAGLCVRDQGGDTAYFKFHDDIFSKTTSNGLGIALTALPDFASRAGVNVATFNSCLSSGKFIAKVDKDAGDASLAGATGTPTFVLGKTGSGDTFTGKVLVGAQPYAAFKTLIDQQLAAK